jgi:hypothetical protein
MHFSYNNFALPRCHKFRHENGAKNIWLQRCFFGSIYLLKLDYLVQILMDRADISRHDLSKCQLSENVFFRITPSSYWSETHLYQAELHFCPFSTLSSFFTVLFDQILFQRGCQVQLFMLFLNIAFKLTTLEILNSKVLSTKICLQSHLELIFCCRMIFQNLGLSRVAHAKTCI